jgi:hypothetical protein
LGAIITDKSNLMGDGEMDNEIVCGDVVTLKSGGLKMTVESIDYYGATVVYICDGRPEHARLTLLALKKCGQR